MKYTFKIGVVIVLLSIDILAIGVYCFSYFSTRNTIYNTYALVENFDSDKLEDYVALHKDYPNLEDKSIVILVNNNIHSINNATSINELLNDDDFDESKIEEYLAYLDNNNCEPSCCLFMVNNNLSEFPSSKESIIKQLMGLEDFDREKLSRYISVSDIQSVDYIVAKQIVDNDFDMIEKKVNIDEALQFSDCTYYIQKNLKDYFAYKSKNTNKSFDEIVRIVNTKTNISFYSNIQQSDISKENLILCNKYYKLDNKYTPSDLVTIPAIYSSQTVYLKKEACDAFVQLCQDASKNGNSIRTFENNGYRSYQYQERLYNSYVDIYQSQKAAEKYVARPGHSDHQIGLTVVVTSNGSKIVGNSFKWVLENCYKYGFINRYPKGKESITGFSTDYLHLRYVGEEAADYIYNHGITFEEYYAYFVEDNAIDSESFINSFN